MLSFSPTFSLSGEILVTTGAVDFFLAAAAVPEKAKRAVASRARVNSVRLIIDARIGAIERGLEAPRCFFSDRLVTPVGNDPLADVDARGTVPEARRARRQAEVRTALHERFGGAFDDRRDRERGVHPERRGDRRGVHAEEALVVERLAAVVDHADVLALGHAAAAERVRGVDALRLRD